MPIRDIQVTPGEYWRRLIETGIGGLGPLVVQSEGSRCKLKSNRARSCTVTHKVTFHKLKELIKGPSPPIPVSIGLLYYSLGVVWISHAGMLCPIVHDRASNRALTPETIQFATGLIASTYFYMVSLPSFPGVPFLPSLFLVICQPTLAISPQSSNLTQNQRIKIQKGIIIFS